MEFFYEWCWNAKRQAQSCQWQVTHKNPPPLIGFLRVTDDAYTKRYTHGNDNVNVLWEDVHTVSPRNFKLHLRGRGRGTGIGETNRREEGNERAREYAERNSLQTDAQLLKKETCLPPHSTVTTSLVSANSNLVTTDQWQYISPTLLQCFNTVATCFSSNCTVSALLNGFQRFFTLFQQDWH